MVKNLGVGIVGEKTESPSTLLANCSNQKRQSAISSGTSSERNESTNRSQVEGRAINCRGGRLVHVLAATIAADCKW